MTLTDTDPDTNSTATATTKAPTFTPKFDVKETRDTYELHGDIPGLTQNAIAIEFTDAETLCIKGKLERRHSSSSSSKTTSVKWNAPTVQDEYNADGEGIGGNTSGGRYEDGSESEEGEKWWVEEREHGEFMRLFTFPVRVDQEKVWAEMRNGVLSVVVPKFKARRIQVYVN